MGKYPYFPARHCIHCGPDRGQSGLCRRLGNEAAAEKLGRTLPGRGVDVTIEGQRIELTVRLVIRYGCRIPDVALEVQKSVKDAVEKATACTVTAVHIIVQQLVFEEDRHDG